MNFGFNEDQDMIRESANSFVKNESSLDRIREMRETETGYSEELWGKIAENGWLAAVVPEEFGGIDLGYADLICITEEFGKGVMPEPLITSSVLAGNAVLFGGTEAQKGELLPQVCEGTLKLTLGAYETAGRFNLAHVEMTASESGGDYTLSGEKCFVPFANSADKILVTARTSGASTDQDGISLFILDKDAAGLSLTAVEVMDRQPRFTLTLNDAKATLLGSAGDAFDAVEHAVDCATIALCAEMVGGMQEALEMTVGYTHERVQFGVPIGSFQALKHKAADMYLALEAARSSMYFAAMTEDRTMPERKEAISAAKALCSENYLAVTKEAIQLHGGIGFTDEHTIQFFYKRAIVAANTFGNAAFHRERYLTEKLAAAAAAEPATV